MLKNYLLIGFRNLVKNRIYTLVNVAGLAIGLASFILIALYIKNEISYDQQYGNAENIYRINTHVDVNGISNHYPAAHYPAAFDMVEDYPEVIKATTLYRAFYLSPVLPKIKYEDNEYEESKFYLADSTFFSVFDFEFKQGNPEKAFENSYSVVLTEETARKYFGNADPMGKLIQFQDSVSLKVTGVLKPLKGKTHLDFDFLVYSKLLLNQVIGFQVDNAYLGLWYYSYVVLQPGASPHQLEAKFPEFVKKYYPPRYTENNAKLTIQNIRDIHLYSDFSTADMSVNGNIQYVFTLGSIAVLVLVIACINFMNLSVARFSNRGKEVGMRKVMGAAKHNLMIQFLGESVMVALLSGLLALAVVGLAIPAFNELASTRLEVTELYEPGNLLVVVGIMLTTGLLAGLYPAVVMASFQPVKVLKGLHTSINRKIDLRKILVVTQFTVSLILLMGTLVISDQLGFMREKNMGFSKEQVIVIPVGGTSMVQNFSAFKNKLLTLPQVSHVTSHSHDIGQGALPYFPMRVEGKEDEQMLPIMYVGFDFLETLGIEMSSGRFFDIRHRQDSTLAFVINESAARALDWKDPVGRKISFGVNGSPESHVIGVIKDFNYDPVRTKVGPLVMKFAPAGNNVSVKLRAGDHRETLKAIEKNWNETINNKAFSCYFLDEALNRTYEEEEKLAHIFTYFSGLAIFVASLGLFALASFSAQRRLKEIGVRKVLGASEAGLVVMMYREFFILIVIAFLLASPLSYYFFNQWLNSFAYHVNISALTYLISVLFISIIALITVGYQSFNAARTNPVIVLRSE